MRKRNAILMGAVAALGMVSAVQAAPIVTTSLRLMSIDDNTVELPKVSGVYQVSQGQHFFVEIDAAVSSPADRTDSLATRSSATRNKPLGIQNLTVDIRQTGPGNLAAVNDGGGNWAGYTDITPSTTGAFPFTSVGDTNGDGNLDAISAGFSNNSLTTGTSAASLRLTQWGVDQGEVGAPIAAGYTSPQGLVLGEYVANGNGLSNLFPFLKAGNTFIENAGDTGNLLSATPFSSPNLQNVQVNVTAAPEPASLGLLGLAGLGLARRRRAK